MSDKPWQLVAAGSARRDIQSLPEKYAAAVLELLPIIAADPKRVGKPLRFAQRDLQGNGSRDQRGVHAQHTYGDRIAAARRRSLDLQLRFREIDDRNDGVRHVHAGSAVVD